ncbi:MAG: STAS domain-containing protein [Tepidisphaeraceae bacterium]|jgi:anti-anti-sigma factor
MIKCEEYSQVCVIEVHGDFLAEAAAASRAAMEDHVARRQIVDYVLDFKQSAFVDSDGLEGLLWMRRRCEDLLGRLKLVNLDENLKKILEMTRLEHRFECQDDLAIALKTMR